MKQYLKLTQYIRIIITFHALTTQQIQNTSDKRTRRMRYTWLICQTTKLIMLEILQRITSITHFFI